MLEQQKQEEVIDEYGFIIMTDDQKRLRRNRTLGRLGLGYYCKSLCKYLPHAFIRTHSRKKTGLYFCATCEIAMGCVRCRCCGRLGRSEPRQRIRLNAPDTKFVE